MSDVTIRLTDEGPARIRGDGQAWEPGDTREVDREHAAELPDYWMVVKDGDQEVDRQAGAEQEDADEGSGGAVTTDEALPDDEPKTCQAVTNDGEECGRELPCQYHNED